MIPKHISDSAVQLLLLAGVAVFFMSKWVFDGAFFRADIISFTAPLENLFALYQRRGELPLWTPEIHGGYPLLANGQVSFFYLPHLLLRQFLSGAIVINLSLWLHTSLAVAGMYGWLRSNRIAVVAACAGSLLFVFGGAMSARFALANFFIPLTWVPLLLFLLQRFYVQGEVRSLWWWTLASALQVVSGNPQAIVLSILAELLFLIVLLVEKFSVRRTLAVAAASLCVGLITLPQTLLVWQILPETDRASGLDREELLDFSFPMRALRGIVEPHPFGHTTAYRGPKGEAEIAAFLGPVAALLAVVGVFLGRVKASRLRNTDADSRLAEASDEVQAGEATARVWWFGSLLVILSFPLALGVDSPIYHWAVDNTPQRFFAIPARYFVLTHFGLVLLAVLGLQSLKAYARSSVLTVVFFAALLVPIVTVAWHWEDGRAWSTTRQPRLVRHLSSDFERVLSQPKLIDEAPNNNFGITSWRAVNRHDHFEQTLTLPYPTIQGIELLFSVPVPVAETGEVVIRILNQAGEQLARSSLPGQTVRDGEYTVFKFDDVTGSQGAEVKLEVSSNIEGPAPRLVLHTNPGDTDYDPTGNFSFCEADLCTQLTTATKTADVAFRVLTAHTTPLIKGHELLGPNVAAGFGIGSAQWTGALGIQAVREYLDALGINNEQPITQNRGLLNRLPVTHLVTTGSVYRQWNEVGIKSVAVERVDDIFLHLYENEQAAPRFHFASQTIAVPSRDQQLQQLYQLPHQDWEVVVADMPDTRQWETSGRASLVADLGSHLIIETQGVHEGFLVVRDLLFPGWRAYVNDKQVPIIRVDALFRGVVVPSGTHTIEFRYEPTAWSKTWPVSLLTLVGLAVGGLVLRVRPRQRDQVA